VSPSVSEVTPFNLQSQPEIVKNVCDGRCRLARRRLSQRERN
jgi:hypothetical protein